MADVFISYAGANKPQAAAIAAAVEAGGRSAWWDRRTIGGDSYGRAIERELDEARAVIVAWSKAARDSLWVRAEANAALDAGKLVQLNLDQGALPLPFTMAPAFDGTMWSGRRGDAPWPALESRLAEMVGSGNHDGGEGRLHPSDVIFVPGSERPLQGFGQVAILGWTAIAAALLTGLFTVAAARGNVSGDVLGVVSLVLLVLAVGLLGVSAFILGRTMRASSR